MVFTDVIAEVIYAWRVQGFGRCEGVKVREAKHIRFADDAGSDGDVGDGGIEFCVGGGEEGFFQLAAGDA